MIRPSILMTETTQFASAIEDEMEKHVHNQPSATYPKQNILNDPVQRQRLAQSSPGVTVRELSPGTVRVEIASDLFSAPYNYDWSWQVGTIPVNDLPQQIRRAVEHALEGIDNLIRQHDGRIIS